MNIKKELANIEKKLAKKDVKGLIKAITPGEWSDNLIREKAKEALVKIGESAVPALIELLPKYSSGMRDGWEMAQAIQIVDALGEIGDMSSVVPLKEAFNKNYEIWIFVLLKDLKMRRYHSQGGYGWFCLRIAVALRRIGDANSFDLIFDDVKGMVLKLTQIFMIDVGKESTLNAFKEIGDVAISPLIKVFQDPFLRKDLYEIYGFNHINIDKGVVKALAIIGKSAVPALIDSFKEPYPGAEGFIAEALGKIGDASAIPILTEALKTDDSLLRAKVVEALNNINATMLKKV